MSHTWKMGQHLNATKFYIHNCEKNQSLHIFRNKQVIFTINKRIFGFNKLTWFSACNWMLLRVPWEPVESSRLGRTPTLLSHIFTTPCVSEAINLQKSIFEWENNYCQQAKIAKSLLHRHISSPPIILSHWL